MPALFTFLLLAFLLGPIAAIGMRQLNDSKTEICFIGNHYALLQNKLNYQEYYWNKTIIATLYLVDIATGLRWKIAENPKALLINGTLSPAEKYATWYDVALKCYRIYDISTGTTHSLPKQITAIVKWQENDTSFIAYDNYDIWEMNLTQSRCLTNHYGRKQKIIFRQLDDTLLIALNTKNKQNGFWRLTKADPMKYTMDDCLYYFPIYPIDQFKPIYANGTYLVNKQTAQSPPNLYTTTNFNIFIPQTAVPPAYTIQVQMMRFKGITGILYMPQEINPTQKYPIIFTYYGKYSNNLHRHLPLQLSEGTLNIPTYISKGYIVFIPDIQVKPGAPGASTAKTIIKSAKHLGKYPFIDKKRMGLQGFSFGGYITNYIITHSDLFAAAQETAGPTDFISGYGSIRKLTGNSYQPLYETGQNEMKVPPWGNLKRYLRNSPILKVHHINTPLLIMHNEDDNQVPWAQAAELFTALRRLQKPVWWLQYKNEGHQLTNLANQQDFTTKQMEFFDHYLKGGPMPEWMSGSGQP
ncbi:alpha/beta hydrolase family protein [Chitinophaga sp. LS1]|uniref:alpha/beta hydrolase family protein n=1 Tax=Chitinophaga sp. LS1 TaxID=3051176 RepID=UPI002AAAA865|nr:prolyl oligopeptidase family serine peptidase [Chitinophaga sp. LS1]WPV67839.1 prolyl oligopeptidase family serine peptidase [Chitinophaga sp. LS1]